MGIIGTLKEKAHWIKRQTLAMHKVAPGIRIASSLSPIEVLTAFYYGGIVRHDPANPGWAERDRVILSKGHGSLAIYPILADRGFFDIRELDHVSRDQSRLGVIPEPTAPGIETTNGSLGHGLGVACGIAIALKRFNKPQSVFVLCGDGEMNSGAVWEAVMFASMHNLDNLVIVIDDNKRSMLGDQKEIMGLDPLSEKLAVFGWHTEEVDGHDLGKVHPLLSAMKEERRGQPKAIIAHTVKGKGIPELESDPLSHVRVLSNEVIDRVLDEWS